MDINPSAISVPKYRLSFERVIFMAYGITPNRILRAYQENNIPCSSLVGDDLDKVLDWDKEERNPQKGSYAIRVRDCVESDEVLKSLSTKDVKVKDIKTETLNERLIHGLKVWSEGKGHLDIVGETNCAGSRYQEYVLYVKSEDGGISIGFCNTGYSSAYFGAREVISL